MNIPKPLRDDSNGAVLSGRHYAGTYYGVYGPTTLDTLDGHHYQDMPTRSYGKCLGIFSSAKEATSYAVEVGDAHVYIMEWLERAVSSRWVKPHRK